MLPVHLIYLYILKSKRLHSTFVIAAIKLPSLSHTQNVNARLNYNVVIYIVTIYWRRQRGHGNELNVSEKCISMSYIYPIVRTAPPSCRGLGCRWRLVCRRSTSSDWSFRSWYKWPGCCRWCILSIQSLVIGWQTTDQLFYRSSHFVLQRSSISGFGVV